MMCVPLLVSYPRLLIGLVLGQVYTIQVKAHESGLTRANTKDVTNDVLDVRTAKHT